MKTKKLLVRTAFVVALAGTFAQPTEAGFFDGVKNTIKNTHSSIKKSVTKHFKRAVSDIHQQLIDHGSKTLENIKGMTAGQLVGMGSHVVHSVSKTLNSSAEE